MTEALLVFLACSLTGGLVALIMFYSWAGSIQLDQTSTWIVVGVPFLAFVTSYLVTRLQVRGMVRSTAMATISSNMSSINLSDVGKPIRIKRFGQAFNMAGRTLLRNKHFGRTALRISVCIFLTTIVFTGALVSWDTSKNYVARAMPPHTLVIGTLAMVDAYQQLGLSFSNKSVSGTNANFLLPGNIINNSIAQKFRDIPGVQIVDTRLMNMTTAEGKIRPLIIDEQFFPPVPQGGARILMVGIDPNQTVADWYSSDGFLSNNDQKNTVVVGDSLVGGIIQQPLNDSWLMAYTATFDVKGAVVEPLNRGYVAYAPVSLLQGLLNVDGYNLLLLKTDETAQTLDTITNT
ncbi:MAG TPA: hypothetical protein VE177_00865, partial [Candidatus Binatus sp.]|nr:hypothetical protein [Candidatus Binatus sp.]